MIENFGEGEPLALIAGPCGMESRELVLHTATRLKEICERLSMPLIFKSSFDKANRTSVTSFRGPGLTEGLKILQEVKELGLPVTTDIHLPDQAEAIAEVADIIQIPAFLCRQTDLIIAAARTGRTVSVKKGQFLSPWDMATVVEKIRSTGNEKIILIDRGVSFGYQNLVSDMRAIPVMKQNGVPVCFDATHSAMRPGGLGNSSGGDREFIPTLAKAAVAAGADLIFLEVHPNPSEALSDAKTQWPLDEIEPLLEKLQQIRSIVCSAVPC